MGHLQHLIGNEVLTGAIALYDGFYQVLRHIVVVGQQLFGVFRETIAAIAEAGVIVMGANTGIKTNAFDNGLCIKSFNLGIGIEFVEVTDSQSEVGIGKEFYGLCLFHAHEKDGDTLGLSLTP